MSDHKHQEHQHVASAGNHCIEVQQLLQEDHTYLTPDQLVLVGDVLETNTHAADTYLAYTKWSYRHAWAKMQVEWAGHQFTAEQELQIHARLENKL